MKIWVVVCRFTVVMTERLRFLWGRTSLPFHRGKFFLRAVFDDCCLRFYWSSDGEGFHAIGPELDASMLADDYGAHWGFTGTFVGLACQDLTGMQQTAAFDYLEVH